MTFRCGSQLQSYSFQASDAFNKQQWLNCIRQAKGAAGGGSGSPAPPSGQEGMEHSDGEASDCSMDTSEAAPACPQVEGTNTQSDPPAEA